MSDPVTRRKASLKTQVMSCSIRQALFWIDQRIEPVPQDHLQHLKRPELINRDDALNNLVLACRERSISTAGTPAILEDDHEEDTVMVLHRCSDVCPPTRVAVPHHPWAYRSIDIENESLSVPCDWQDDDYLNHWTELASPYFPQINPSYGFLFAHVSISVSDLKGCFPARFDQERRGAPAKYRWNDFYAEIAVRADRDNLPDKQADLERDMLLWCEDTWGQAPAESVVRERIAPIYRHPRKAGKSGK
jgi:hypothetical protein